MLSVIMVAKGLFEMSRRCIETLVETIGGRKIEFIYVDNGTPPGENSWRSMSDWLASDAVNRDVLRVAKMIKFPEPGVNLSTAWNAGVNISVGDPLLIINNDITFSAPGWWEEFELALADPNIGVVGLNGLSWHYVPFIQGSIFAITRDTWNKIGPFDEDFSFSCEDVDYSKRIQDYGLQIRSFENLRDRVHHAEGATRNHFKDNILKYQELAHIARVKFCYKYSLLPQITD